MYGHCQRQGRNADAKRAVGAAPGVSGVGGVAVGDAGFDQTNLESAGADAARDLLRTSVLCNEATLQIDQSGAARPFGDKVDIAFLLAARNSGIDPDGVRAAAEEQGTIPYEAERRFAAFLERNAGIVVAHVKGAAETVLPMCEGVDEAGVLREVESLGRQGYRVLALAAGAIDLPPDESPEGRHLAGLRFLGLAGLIDPLRPEARSAVEACRRAGVRVCMVTGDHPATALAIARELGLAVDDTAVLTGDEFGTLDDRSRAARVRAATVFARVEPLQKLDIVQALQQDGDIVAVTGDGANDAPALNAADIDVAMGRGGTDAARGAADLIVADDNFASIVAGVGEGRIAYDNIRKVIYHLIATNAAEIVLFVLAIGAGLPLPLTAVQLLWLNVATEGFQHIALAFEKGEPGVLRRQPRPPRQPIFDRRMISQTLFAGSYGGGMAFALFAVLLELGWTTGAASNALLLFLVLFENVQSFNCRSETRSAFRTPLRNNPLLVVGVALALAVHVGAMYAPGLRAILDIGPLSPAAWAAIVVLALGTVAVMEVYKFVVRRKDRAVAPPPA